MKKIIRLTESDLRKIFLTAIRENEEDWISQSEDIEMESDFPQMEKLKDIEEFQELVDIFKNDKELADYYRKRLGMNVNESYKYYDYGDNKKEITKSHYRKRKLATYTVATLASAIVGYMMGTMAQDQVLEAALLAAGMGGFTFGSLASEVGREKVKDDEQINEMEDEEFMRGADKNWGEREDYGTMRGRFFDNEEEDEEWGETDRGEEDLQDLLEEARDILENELGYSIDAINEMDEYDIVDELHAHFYNELAYEIEHLLEKEGFYDIDEDEPYDSIGGHSVNDLKKAFAKTKSDEDPFDEYTDFDDEEYA